MATSDRSISVIFQDVLRNLQEIIRSEVRLAKTEVREEIIKAKAASLVIACGALSGIFGVLFLLLGGLFALALIVPMWEAAFILTIVLLAVAAITIRAGREQFKRVHPVPDKTLENVKENVEWAKQQTK